MWRWMDSFGRCHLSLTQLLLTAKRFAPRAKITDQELSCRQMQPTGSKTGDIEVGPAWTIGLGKHYYISRWVWLRVC